MDGNELIIDALGRVQRILHRSLEGLSATDVNRQPVPHANSMAWLAWHLTRIQDDHVADIGGVPQVWLSGDWPARFNRKAEPKETGHADTLEQVAALQVDSPALLLAYHDAVYAQSKAVLAKLSPQDLELELNEPQYTPLPTVGVRLVSVVSDNTQHAGQVAYLRGYFQGLGGFGA
ncbi:MAG: DUF664 domain-containing protein [Chloroflexota bacterium]